MAMMPPAASEVPWPVKVQPPAELPDTSVAATIVAVSVAETVTPAPVTLPPEIAASTELLTSLSTIAAPMPTDGDCVKLMPCGTIVVSGTGFQMLRSL